MATPADFLAHRPFGRTGLMVGRRGSGTGYNVPAAAMAGMDEAPRSLAAGPPAPGEPARARRSGDFVRG